MPAGPAARDTALAVRRVLAGLLVANLSVVAAKVVIGLASHSLAVLGDALHSSVDSLYNVVGLIVVRVAAREPDEDHPYGHGKFETVGALAIVMFLSITCFELVRSAVNKLTGDIAPITVTDLGLAVLVATLGINVLVAWYEHRRGQELGSELLIADAAHTRTDVFITVGVLIGVLFARQGAQWVDPVVAIVVALLIVRVGYQIVSRTIPVLVDERAIATWAIQDTAQSVDGVMSAYGIRSRGRGARARYAEVTIAVDRHANVEAAHAIADEVEERLKRDLQLSGVTVHVEPC